MINMLSGDEISIQEGYYNQKRGFSTARALNDILKELSDLYWVVSAAVIRRDGILMASNMTRPAGSDSKNACALISATIVGAAKNITTKCRMGFPKLIIIQAKEGDIIISEAGSKALLVCLTNERYHPTLMSPEINRAAQSVAAIL
ncbi:MAG: roadblock/LC7 domain-containing protein [Methanomassiliicoccales archaeon]|nr:MAG: roadblock/LC7 domain-containing protein [Methanomassiliicoccales archaeon]